MNGIPGRRHLRLARRGDLDFPRVNLATYGGRAFAYAGPTSWNSLHDSLKDINHTLQTFKRQLKTFLFFYILAHSARFRFLTKTRYINPLLLLYNGLPLLPSKLTLPMGDLDPHLTHGSLGPPESSTQRASRSVQRLTVVIDRPTERQTTLLALYIGHIYAYIVLRCGLKRQKCR